MIRGDQAAQSELESAATGYIDSLLTRDEKMIDKAKSYVVEIFEKHSASVWTTQSGHKVVVSDSSQTDKDGKPIRSVMTTQDPRTVRPKK